VGQITEDQRALEDIEPADEIDFVVAGGIRNGADIAKDLALGAKAVAIGHSAMMALNCNKEIPGVTDYEGTVGVPAGQCYHCHTGRCPVGVATQDPELRKRLVVEEAAERVSAWRGRNRDGAPLRFGLPAGPGGDVLFRQLSADLGAIGLKSQKVPLGAAADLRLVDQVARYPRIGWFLNQLSCAARQTLCSPTADSLAARARTETDPAIRAELLSDAEAELTRTNGFIPFGTPIRWSLVSGSVTGFAVNRWAVHPLMPLAMIPK